MAILSMPNDFGKPKSWNLVMSGIGDYAFFLCLVSERMMLKQWVFVMQKSKQTAAFHESKLITCR